MEQNAYMGHQFFSAVSYMLRALGLIVLNSEGGLNIHNDSHLFSNDLICTDKCHVVHAILQ